MSTGRHIAAAQMMGADLAYLGTRFIATKESMADERFKQMVLDANASDVLYTQRDQRRARQLPQAEHRGERRRPGQHAGRTSDGYQSGHKRAWKDVWSAGQGVGSVHDIPTTAELCARLRREYVNAVGTFAGEAREYTGGATASGGVRVRGGDP